MAKKANSAYDGIPIQIKRTELSLSKDSERKVIEDDGALKYGEPLYLEYQVTDPQSRTHNIKYMAIGTATGNTPTSELNVFKAARRDLVEGTFFYDQTTRANTDACSKSGERVEFIDQEGNSLYSKIRRFTVRDKDGIPTDIEGNHPQIKVNNPMQPWYKVSEKTGEISGDPAGLTDFPKAQYITVPNMTTDTVPYIGLAIPNSILGSKPDTKDAKKSFSNITSVKSENGRIAVYCGFKNLKKDCYIDIFGG